MLRVYCVFRVLVFSLGRLCVVEIDSVIVFKYSLAVTFILFYCRGIEFVWEFFWEVFFVVRVLCIARDTGFSFEDRVDFSNFLVVGGEFGE